MLHLFMRKGPWFRAKRRGYGTGPLWALIGALVIALGGLSWWSYQQVLHMQESIVATQDAFARISEEAAGRIQDISGKVVATESSVTSDSEALKLRIKQLETRLAEVTKQQQNLNGQQSGQGKRLDQLAADLKAQQGVTDGRAARPVGRLVPQSFEHGLLDAQFNRIFNAVFLHGLVVWRPYIFVNLALAGSGCKG